MLQTHEVKTHEVKTIAEALLNQMESRVSVDPNFGVQITSITVHRRSRGNTDLSATAKIYMRFPDDE